MNNSFKAFTALILCAAQLALVSCGGQSALPSDTDAAAPSATTVPETTTEETLFLPDNLPEKTDLKGRGVTIFVREDNIKEEFYVDAENGEVVNDALFARNRNVGDRLNVKLKFIASPGEFWNDREKYLNSIISSVKAGDKAYDIAGGLSKIMPQLMLEGVLQNLTDAPHLDFDMPWWQDGLREQLSIGGKLYMASGEASLAVVRDMICIFFNKKIAADYKLEDVYATVEDGKWTIDKLEALSKAVYTDLNGNGTADNEDRFGFTIVNSNHNTAFVEAFDVKMTEKDKNDIPTLVFGSAKTAEAVTRLCKLLEVPGIANQKDGVTTYTDMFAHGLTLFSTGEFKDNLKYRDLDFDYGVIPYPKWNEAQSKYYNSARSTFTIFGIPKGVDLDTACMVLEAFASESYRTVTPAFYEVALKVKYSRDDTSARMYDLIKSTVVFNFGVTYTTMLNDVSLKFRSSIVSKNPDWASTYAAAEPAAKAALEKLVAAALALE